MCCPVIVPTMLQIVSPFTASDITVRSGLNQVFKGYGSEVTDAQVCSKSS